MGVGSAELLSSLIFGSGNRFLSLVLYSEIYGDLFESPEASGPVTKL